MLAKLFSLLLYCAHASCHIQSKNVEYSDPEEWNISRQQRRFLAPVLRWAEWESWSQSRCTVPCAGGTMLRHRQCLMQNNEPTAAGYCERLFYRPSMESRNCNTQTCTAPHWSAWYTWSACSKTCDRGVRYRVRLCEKSFHEQSNCTGNNTQLQVCSHNCQGNPTTTTQPTTQSTTPPTTVVTSSVPDSDGMWSSWGSWSKCSRSCGRGIHFRRRSCDNPAPSGGGHACYGDSGQTQGCVMPDCPVLGWSKWGTWSRCSGSCGSGIQLRVRSCPYPNSGLCQGDAMERQLCSHQQSCLVLITSTTAGITTTKSATQTASTLSTTTSTAVSTALLPSCFDHAVCSDPKTKSVACKDAYIASSYCPKMCGLCGASTGLIANKCEDKAGVKCRDSVYQMFTCPDQQLVHLCERTCQICH